MKKTFSIAQFRHEPHAHQAAFDAMGFDAQRRGERRAAARFLDQPREPLLRVADLPQRRETPALLLEQRR